ncbi:hypothetical protein DFR67_106207 [Williamsia limnetica]|uniref:DUF1269 domain-containing protein n=1 Tax=Williamsia limnetica TaxID=882452 RepID=A0A318RWD8_WILLI|nr:DUF6325 family protein [Williamsia limnetica]PYE17504.1 hypothetical protein DFR67_106207 [Williamsia limnetica]
MANQSTELGPVDYVVVEFPSGVDSFTPSMTDTLISLVDREIIRVLDLLVMVKTADGDIEVSEFEEFGKGTLSSLNGALAEILAAEDIRNLARAIKPGFAAGVIVWENTGIAPISATATDIGASIVAQGRIPTRALIATIAADQQSGT